MKRNLFLIVFISLLLTSCAVQNSDLVQATKEGNVRVVKVLLSKNADVNTRDANDNPILMWAAYNGHTEVVKLLLEKGADVNVKKTNAGTTALWIASQEGHTAVVKLLLENGADVNVKKTDTGITALWIASQNGHTDVVKLLLDKGADVNVRSTDDGTTALYIASQNGHTEVVKLLLEKGADVNMNWTTIGITSLWVASMKGHTDIVKLLLEKGADVNVKRTTDDITPLWMASQNGHTDVVKILLYKGAEVNVRSTDDGTNALFLASQNGHTEVVNLLLEKGADVNVKRTTDGATALLMASQNGHIEVVKLLLEKNADVNVKLTTKGKTALWQASQDGHTDIVKLLLEKDADVNVKETDTGITALYAASHNGHIEVVKLLLEKGADVTLKTNSGITALGIAEQRKITEIVQLLEKVAVNTEFDKAREAGTTEAMRAYIKRWPNSPFNKEAEILLDALSFAEIKKNPTVSLCQTYLTNFKNGAHSTEVINILKSLKEDEVFASVIKTKVRAELRRVLKNYPAHPSAGVSRDLLAERDRELAKQCQDTLGGNVLSPDIGPASLEMCASAKISMHEAYAGDYIGVVLSIPPFLIQLNDNTFLEYEDGKVVRSWIVWFPDLTSNITVWVQYGTSISVKIDMQGIDDGIAVGASSGSVSLGYGSMLFHDGLGRLRWHMAYTNQGKNIGSLMACLLDAPSERLLLLFPKHSAKVKKISIAGCCEFDVVP